MSMSGGFSTRPKPRTAQFQLMVSFMEQHGDISNYNHDRLENLQKWSKLTELLNNKRFGNPKPVNKWRKCWSDFKNNTKKKLERIKRGQMKVDLTDLERRLLVVLKNTEIIEKNISETEDNDPIQIKEEIQLEMRDRTLSPPSLITPDFLPTSEVNGRCNRKSPAPSYASTSSCSDSRPVKRRKRLDNGVNDITKKYIVFEREKEKMLHEREMARIKQNDQLFAIFGRIVSVLETLAPSIQRYLDRNSNNVDE